MPAGWDLDSQIWHHPEKLCQQRSPGSQPLVILTQQVRWGGQECAWLESTLRNYSKGCPVFTTDALDHVGDGVERKGQEQTAKQRRLWNTTFRRRLAEEDPGKEARKE